MNLPFSTEQFFNVIEKYNLSIFPFQLIINVLGIACLFLLHSKWSSKDKIIGIYLGALWIWIGAVYHLAFFATINKAALLFGVIFILQGVLILYYSLIKKPTCIHVCFSGKGLFGLLFHFIRIDNLSNNQLFC